MQTVLIIVIFLVAVLLGIVFMRMFGASLVFAGGRDKTPSITIAAAGFDKIRAGKKTAEIRLNRGFFERIRPADKIMFKNSDDRKGEMIKAVVTDIIKDDAQKYDIAGCVKKVGHKALGFASDSDAVADISQYYKDRDDAIKESGMVGIVFKIE